MKLIKNAVVWTMAEASAVYDPGYILIDEGKVRAAGPMGGLGDIQAETVIDANGQIVMPGMIDAHCHIGIFGEASGRENADGNEMIDPVTPFVRAIDGINPQDIAFPEALAGGVTTVCTGPGSANVICGTFAILKTHGDTVEEMAVVEDYALKIAMGENPKRCYGRMLNKAPATRMGTAAIFRREVENAKAYAEKEAGGEADLGKAFFYQYILKALRREIPLKIHAHRADDIYTAIRLSDAYGFTCTLDHCTEGYKIAKDLKASGKRTIVGPIILSRCKVELNDSRTDNAAILFKEGVPFCIATDSPCIPVGYLSVSAGYVVSQGLPEEEALKAITLYPAQTLGIADRVGSIEPGKDADLVFLDGHLFDLESKITQVMIEGETVYTNPLA